jgi:hypothetical protein
VSAGSALERKTDVETRFETSQNEPLAKTWISWRSQLTDATFGGTKRFCESKASDGVCDTFNKMDPNRFFVPALMWRFFGRHAL